MLMMELLELQLTPEGGLGNHYIEQELYYKNNILIKGPLELFDNSDDNVPIELPKIIFWHNKVLPNIISIWITQYITITAITIPVFR